MPANRFNGFSDFGIGIGLRVPHYQHILSEKPVVDWFEIISENYIRQDHSDGAMTSNAISARKRARLHKVARQKAATVFLAVHRIDHSVYFKRLEAEAFAFLSALRDGKSLSVAAAAAFEGHVAPESKLLGVVQKWFETWSRLGWFCRPQSASTKFTSS